MGSGGLSLRLQIYTLDDYSGSPSRLVAELILQAIYVFGRIDDSAVVLVAHDA